MSYGLKIFNLVEDAEKNFERRYNEERAKLG